MLSHNAFPIVLLSASACIIDWPLALDFLRILAAPLGAIVIAFLASQTYRNQKRFDRRSDWYQQVHSLLGRTAALFRWAAEAHLSGDHQRAKARLEEALAASLALSERMSEGFLFGVEADLVAIRDFGLAFQPLQQEVASNGHVSVSTSDRAVDACLVASNALAIGYRKELGLKAINLNRLPQ